MEIYSANITVITKEKTNKTPEQRLTFTEVPYTNKTTYKGYRIVKVEKLKVIGKTNKL